MTTSTYYDKKQGDHIKSKYDAPQRPNSMGAHKAFSYQEGATSWAYGYLQNTRPLL